VKRYLLDTNVISDAIKPQPSPLLAKWMSQQEDDSLFISTVNLGELQSGILQLPPGRKRTALTEWFEGPTGPQKLFADRILSFDAAASLAWGEIIARGRREGRPRSVLDAIIASIALSNNCLVVTGNEDDFLDVEVFNPFKVP
jgi:predicted nucleic acid-binding protein